MKKFVLALAASTFLAGAAFAATVEGVIKAFDKEKGVIVLEDGTSYNIPKEALLPPDLAVGQKVTITTIPTDRGRGPDHHEFGAVSLHLRTLPRKLRVSKRAGSSLWGTGDGTSLPERSTAPANSNWAAAD